MSAPLPSLPPAFRVRDEDVRPGGRSMIDILVADHRELAELCRRLHEAVPAASDPDLRAAGPAAVNGPGGFAGPPAGEKLCAPGRPDAVDSAASSPDGEAGCTERAEPRPGVRPVAEVLVATLSRHLSAEEQYLYPTVRAVLPDGPHVADQELVEDEAMIRTLRQLHTTPADDPAFAALVDTASTQVRRHAERAAREIFPRLHERCSANELIRLGNRVQIAQEAAPTRPHPATPVTPPANKVIDPAVAVLDKMRDALTGRPTRSEDLEID